MKRSLFALVAIAAVWSVFSVLGSVPAHAQVVGVTSPTVPTNINAVAGPSAGQITVTWSASTESSGTIAGYYVYRSSGAYSTTDGTSFVDTVLSPGVYTYSVAAYDSNGNVSARTPSFSVVIAQDTTPPSAPTGVAISGVTTTNQYDAPTTLTISWNVSTDNVGVAGYSVYRDGTMITTTTPPLTATSWTDSVLPGGYSYVVYAYDAQGNVSVSSAPATVTVTLDYLPPTIPTGLAVQQVGVNEVALSWASSTDSIGVTGYQVFRDGIWLASTTAPSYEDDTVATGTQYSYTVTAYDVAGNISSQSQSVTIYPQQTNGPSAPNIGSLLVGTSSANIFWSAPYSVIAIADYTIYRDGAAVATVTSTGYLDTGLTPGTHTYTVTASDISGAVSLSSATSTLVVPVPSAAPASVASAATTTTVPSTAVSVGASSAFTQSLYYGIRTAQVTALQSLLAANGYMSSAYATGFFGSITLKALEQFQCAHDIVCTDGAGWGIVGPKTRAVLNSLEGGTGGASTSTAAQLTELQTLEAELTSLQAQFSAEAK